MRSTSWTFKAVLLAVSAVSAAVLSSCGGLDKAEDFEIEVYDTAGAINGPTTTLEEVLSQGKPVALNFWGGKCPPCVEEMPRLEYAAEQYAGKAIVVGVDLGPFTGLGSHDDARALLEELEITSLPTGYTDDGSVIESYNVTGLPYTVFIRPDGAITETWYGSISWTQLERRIDSLIDSQSADSADQG